MNCLGSHRSNKHCCFSSLSSFFFLLLSGSGLSNFHVRVKDSCGCSWLVFHHRFQAHALQRQTHGGQRVLLYKLISSPPKLLLVSTDCSVSYTRWFRHASNIGQEIVRKSCMRFVVVSVLFQMKLNDNQSRQSGLNSMMLQGQIQLGQYSFTFVSTFFFFYCGSKNLHHCWNPYQRFHIHVQHTRHPDEVTSHCSSHFADECQAHSQRNNALS